jgi:hypothetical protein
VTTRLRPLAALALIALIGAGCASEKDEPATAKETATKAPSRRSRAARFSECMRENGVKTFPDPDTSGELTIDGVLNGSSLDSDAPAFKQAIAACKALQPSGFTGRTRSSAQQDAALEFARCIRENGVRDFPDPIKDQPLVDTNRIPSSNQPGGMDTLNAAMQACRERARAAGVG